MTALFFVPAIVFHPSPSTGFSLLHNPPYRPLRLSVLVRAKYFPANLTALSPLR